MIVGDEEVVTMVSLFNIDAVQIIPDTFYYNYQEMLSPPVPAADADKPTNLLVLQYPFQWRPAVQHYLLTELTVAVCALCVCVLTRVAQIVTATYRDLYPTW